MAVVAAPVVKKKRVIKRSYEKREVPGITLLHESLVKAIRQHMYDNNITYNMLAASSKLARAMLTNLLTPSRKKSGYTMNMASFFLIANGLKINPSQLLAETEKIALMDHAFHKAGRALAAKIRDGSVAVEVPSVAVEVEVPSEKEDISR